MEESVKRRLSGFCGLRPLLLALLKEVRNLDQEDERDVERDAIIVHAQPSVELVLW
jgi:hypothetical protein